MFSCLLILIEAITLYSLLNQPHLFSPTQHRFILIIIVPLHVCYMFLFVLRSSSGMSIQNFYKERHKTNKNLKKEYPF